jgi:hypothetical protein
MRTRIGKIHNRFTNTVDKQVFKLSQRLDYLANNKERLLNYEFKKKIISKYTYISFGLTLFLFIVNFFIGNFWLFAFFGIVLIFLMKEICLNEK